MSDFQGLLRAIFWHFWPFFGKSGKVGFFGHFREFAKKCVFFRNFRIFLEKFFAFEGFSGYFSEKVVKKGPWENVKNRKSTFERKPLKSVRILGFIKSHFLAIFGIFANFRGPGIFGFFGFFITLQFITLLSITLLFITLFFITLCCFITLYPPGRGQQLSCCAAFRAFAGNRAQHYQWLTLC